VGEQARAPTRKPVQTLIAEEGDRMFDLALDVLLFLARATFHRGQQNSSAKAQELEGPIPLQVVFAL
jgi:hypothetical protein